MLAPVVQCTAGKRGSRGAWRPTAARYLSASWRARAPSCTMALALRAPRG